MEQKPLKVWLGIKWPGSQRGTLCAKLGDFCEFVESPEMAEIVLVNDGIEINGLDLPPHILCISLERPWIVQSHHVHGVKFSLIYDTFRIIYVFGLSRAGIVETTVTKV